VHTLHKLLRTGAYDNVSKIKINLSKAIIELACVFISVSTSGCIHVDYTNTIFIVPSRKTYEYEIMNRNH
jgi:hypothetical protein